MTPQQVNKHLAELHTAVANHTATAGELIRRLLDTTDEQQAQISRLQLTLDDVYTFAAERELLDELNGYLTRKAAARALGTDHPENTTHQ